MPKFVIERHYLLPIYQRLIIDAPDVCANSGRPTSSAKLPPSVRS